MRFLKAKICKWREASKRWQSKKKCTYSYAKNLYKTKSISALEESIKSHMEERNVINIYFWLEIGKHIDICNVQCLNTTLYTNFSKKNGKIQGKYVEFYPHSKSIDGINVPSSEELIRLGFTNVNIEPVNTIEALKNVCKKGYRKEDLNKMVEKVVNQGTTKIHKEMSIMKKK